ncbi:MAG: hypothetical protein DMG51_17990 [Acidobacteria bacterium]|nr:MAG: hypothetical protein DMG51_17990 [Acidobacteriota bacterium]
MENEPELRHQAKTANDADQESGRNRWVGRPRAESSQGRQVRWARDGYMNVDRRLVRLEAKFDLIEKMAAPG